MIRNWRPASTVSRKKNPKTGKRRNLGTFNSALAAHCLLNCLNTPH
jgi:hypothetical protein